MAQVSRHPLSKAIENRMFEVFWKSLANLRKSSDVELFLYDLLSPTERTMLAKRLAIAVLLSKDYDQRSISNILKVSLTTVSKISLKMQLQGAGFKKVIERVLLDEELSTFFLELGEGIAKLLAGHPANKRRIAGHFSDVRRRRSRAEI